MTIRRSGRARAGRKWLMGHAVRDVTEKHYTVREAIAPCE